SGGGPGPHRRKKKRGSLLPAGRRDAGAGLSEPPRSGFEKFYAQHCFTAWMQTEALFQQHLREQAVRYQDALVETHFGELIPFSRMSLLTTDAYALQVAIRRKRAEGGH